MDQRAIRDLLRQLGELQRRQVRYRQGVVTDDSPLSVALGGSDVPVTSVASLDISLSIGDPVAVLTFGNDLLVLGAIGADLGSGGGGGGSGAAWHTGSGAPASGLGAVGDFYLNSANGDFYEKTGASTWTLSGNLKGPTGATGADGADMAVTAFATGTQTATISTEHFVSSPNVAGLFTLHVDTVNMVANDVLELRVYQKVLTGGTQRVVFYGRIDGAQPTDDTVKVTLQIGNDLAESNALRFSLKQTAGTGRDFPWKVLRVGS